MKNREALCFIARNLSPEPDSSRELEARILSGGEEWPRIASLASAHYVVPSLYPALQRRGLTEILPSDLRDYLVTVWALSRERNERLRSQLTDLVRNLNLVGVVPLALKGANVLLPNPWPGACDRVLGDLDTLVLEELLPEAVSAMRRGGYRMVPEKFSGSATAIAHYHLRPFIHPDRAACVELHTQLGRGVLASLLPCDRIRHEPESRTLGDTRVLQPAPDWRLLDGLLHTGVSDHHRRRSLELRQLNDWVQVRRRHESHIPWSVMQRRLAESGQVALLPSYLLLARTLFGQSLPDGVQIETQARRMARETLKALDKKWMARRFRAGVWLHRLPRRLRLLPRRLVTPSWYAYRLRRW